VNVEELRAEKDPEKLRAEAFSLLRRTTQLEAENAILLQRLGRLVGELATATNADRQQALGFEIKKLNEQLAAKNRELFGSSRSERRGSPDELAKPKKKQPGHGPTKQLKLPVMEIKHVRADPKQECCHQIQPVMAGQTEDTDQVTIIERRVVVCRHMSQKYRCTLCGSIDVAAGAPAPLVPGGRYTPEFAVAVAVDKYEDHLPLDRQVHRFERQGLVVTTQTLWDQLQALYALLLGAYLAIHAHVLAQPVVGADESTWRVMGKGRSAKWWTWVLVSEQAAFYSIAPTRGSAAAEALLKGFTGVVSVDGYSVYTALEARGTQMSIFDIDGVEGPKTFKFVLVCCWMHARRGFINAENAGHPSAKRALDLIAKLYLVEDKAERLAKETGEDLIEVRRRLRDGESRGIVAALHKWLYAEKPVPSLKLDKAITYAKNQWPRLIRFLDEPRAPIDNGWAERAIRGTVLGRKNHYGSHSEAGTRVAALFYTITETCKLLGIEPGPYMLEAARRAKLDRANVLTPMAWKAELAARAVAPLI